MNNNVSGQKNKNIQEVKNKDSRIELMLRHELWVHGVRYRKNVTRIIGKPDIAFMGKRVAVFCDSEFWHGYDWEKQKEKIKTNREFWIPKIERNIERDKEITETLEADGWIVLRFWGNEIIKHVGACANVIVNVLEERNRCN